MLSVMPHGRKINKTQDQLHHTSKPCSDIAALLLGCAKTKHMDQRKQRIMSPTLLFKTDSKWPSPISAEAWQQTQCMCNIVYSLSSIFGPVRPKRESCDSSLTSKPSESPSDIKQKSRGMWAVMEKFCYHEECELWRRRIGCDLNVSL